VQRSTRRALADSFSYADQPARLGRDFLIGLADEAGILLFAMLAMLAMPLRVDMRFMLWRAMTSLPVVAVLSLIFIRTRRLPPLIVAHWTADALAVLVTAHYRRCDAEPLLI
jgi:hypothetical protein